MPSSLVVDQLAHLLDTHDGANLVVFVPRSQIGHALETALARHTTGWHGVQATIPRHYAESIAAVDVLRSGRSENPVEAALFRAAQMLAERPELEAEHDDLPSRHHLARTVAEVIRTLREDGVSPEAVARHAEQPDTADALRIVATCYQSYEEALETHQLYDDADVFQWARRRVAEGNAFGVAETVYAVSNAVEVAKEEARFLDALRANGRAFWRVGAPSATTIPRDRCAHVFADVPLVEPESNDQADRDSHTGGPPSFTRAVGATNEVDAALRDVLESDAPFDDATIAYVSTEPYATLIADRAEAAGIPLTTGTGLAASQSRSGRMLRRWFEWIMEDYDPAVLIHMLREELLRVDRWLRKNDDAEGSLYAHEVATIIAERSYEPGRDGLLKGLGAAQKRLQQQEAPLSEPERIELETLTLVTELVSDLTGLVPRESTVQVFARRCGQLLERFGPDDPPPESREESERTVDEAARAVLWQRLDRLTRLPVAYEASAGRLASLFQKWLDGQYVQAEHSRPGCVHVLPLESAGYGDRSNLYVVGLDSAGLSAPPSDNGLLREADRNALAGIEERMNTRPVSASDELLWDVQHALDRHRGPVAYYTRVFDLDAGEECDPSAFFLAKERAARADAGRADASRADAGRVGAEQQTRTVGLVPEKAAPSLFDRDGWLQAYQEGKRQLHPPDGPSARQVATDVYGWLMDGAAAQAARDSDAYTEHDGMLPAGTYARLDLFGDEVRAVSASRLQTLAETPYVYFLKYVLGARPLDEPALEDEAWLNPLRKGKLLHEIYEVFVRDLQGRVPTPSDEATLHQVVDEVLEAEVERFAPPSELVRASARRELIADATVFFRAEMDRDPAMQPEAFELGFGMSGTRRTEGDLDGEARLRIGEHTMSVSGRIDRVDRHTDTGALSIWDYKTGSSTSFDETDPVQDGKTLQWALYAYALEALRGETVVESGYYFATASEMGTRLGFSPDAHRAEVEAVIEALRDLTRTGTFPLSPKLHDNNTWKYNGYDRVVGNLQQRRDQIREKEYPDRPMPPSFE